MTGSSSEGGSYEQGLKLADAGRHEEALALLQEHLLGSPEDGQALNDAGALLYALGRLDEAREHLKKALEHIDGCPAETLSNLAEVNLAAARPEEAMAMLGPLAQAEVLSPDLVNRIATGFLDNDDPARAAEAILCSLSMAPEQEEVLRPILENVHRLRPKVAFFCGAGDRQYMDVVCRFAEPRFETKTFEGSSPDEMFELMRWCDIAWFEWCTTQLAAASQHSKVCRIIARLHHFEVFQPWVAQTKWENVDVLVTSGNSAILEMLAQRAPQLEEKTRLVEVPIGVDLEELAFVDRPRGKNLLCLSELVLPRNPMFVLQCFAKLHSIDPEYRLSFAGQIHDDVLEQYLRHMVAEMELAASVSFDGWQEDLAGYLEDKHYVVSASLVEGQPVQIHEAMARGLKPVVHSFPGCRRFLPEECLFLTAEDFCQRILEEPYRPQSYRDFVSRDYSQVTYLAKVNEIFLAMERRAEAPAAPPAGATSDAEEAGESPGQE